MLYTVIPVEDVLEGWEVDPPQTVDVMVGGVLLQVEPLSQFTGRVERVISSDPQVYLDPQFQPGSVLRWT
ncbi:MAG: hypothetical protein AA931_02040 [Peptococcaceae bacterium 1109]|nr:MAG: hypothetical protein AA931_02040 [Peptococcaceae bacterium 1109]